MIKAGCGVDHKSDQPAPPKQMVRTADPTGAGLRRIRCADRPRCATRLRPIADSQKKKAVHEERPFTAT
jgi:hypothetical protein